MLLTTWLVHSGSMLLTVELVHLSSSMLSLTMVHSFPRVTIDGVDSLHPSDTIRVPGSIDVYVTVQLDCFTIFIWHYLATTVHLHFLLLIHQVVHFRILILFAMPVHSYNSVTVMTYDSLPVNGTLPLHGSLSLRWYCRHLRFVLWRWYYLHKWLTQLHCY